MRLHHVQVAMPRGEEGLARAFYADALGMTEVEKPGVLATRGGCWFRAYEGAEAVKGSSEEGASSHAVSGNGSADQDLDLDPSVRTDAARTVTAEIHLGVEDPFTPAKKAHPALVVEDVEALEELSQRVAEHGFEVSWAERETFDGYVRFHCRDGFGNRVEVLTPR